MLVFLQRYDGNLYDENHKLKKRPIREIMKSVGVSTVIVIAVVALLVWGIQPLKVTLNATSFEIKGMYGDVYNYDQIENLELLSEIPKILLKTNGAAIGGIFKGHFKIEEYGDATLFINRKYNRFIYFEYADKKIIFNLETEKSESVYDALTRKVRP